MSAVLHVSHHAVVRYLERIVGVDLSRVRRKLGGRAVTDGELLRHLERHGICDTRFLERVILATVQTALQHPGCHAVCMGGYRYVISNDCVVTIEKVHHPDKALGRDR